MSRAARLYEELGGALADLGPIVVAARREAVVHGDLRTILCNRQLLAESARDRLLDVLHGGPAGTSHPQSRELTRTASCLVAAIAELVSRCPVRDHGRASTPLTGVSAV